MNHKLSAYQTDAVMLPINAASALHVRERLPHIIAPVLPLGNDRLCVDRRRHLDLGSLSLEILCAPERLVHMLSVRDTYSLLYASRGHVRLQRGGACIELGKGELVLLDDSEPRYFEIEQDSQLIIVYLHKGWLSRWIPHCQDLVAQPMAGEQGWASPLCAMLRTVVGEGIDELLVPHSVICEQIGSLISLLPGQEREQLSPGGKAVFSRLQALVHESFRNPGFSPESAAQELGISKRHLHAVCAQANTTFSRLLMGQRLKRAQEKLEDSRYSRHRICDIAFMCGFSDPSHFARRFRDTYGVGPKAYRKAAV